MSDPEAAVPPEEVEVEAAAAAADDGGAVAEAAGADAAEGGDAEMTASQITLAAQAKHVMKDSEIKDPVCDIPDNLVAMEEMTQPKLLDACKQRFENDAVYTFVADILVAINPYQWIDMYGTKYKDRYNPASRLCPVPHIYAVAQRAAKNLRLLNRDQVCIVSGESGAGKTESAKLFMHHLLTFSDGGAGHSTRLEQQILESQPLLEAFGNAKTGLNDNSSRFGKYIEIIFQGMDKVLGAGARKYLLEKSRVVTQAEGERTFHAPYQLLKGAPQELREELLLTKLDDYKFISTSRHELDEMDDETEWDETNAAFKIYGLSPDEIKEIWRVIAAVLTFGQLEFTDGAGDQAVLANDTAAQKAAALFGINAVDLTKALTKPRIKAGGELVQKAQNTEEVNSVVKALAKSIYEKLFLWIVTRINKSLDQAKGRSSKHFIGILDIAGFEIFEKNSFEQLLINFTNEKLQQLFNRRMFVLEQEEYKREGIEWTFIDFGLDLQPTIDCISGKGGLLPILDEESIFPAATDKTLLQKYDQNQKGVKSYQPTNLRMKGDFAVRHYAGEVVYQIEGWLFKNRDPLNDNVVALLKESSNPFMKSLWSVAASINVSARHRGALRTVAGIYNNQLKELMETLTSTTPNFVRCIKPNHLKKPGVLDAPLIIDQLRCGGVLEGIRIVRKGFPNRVEYADFRQRYQILTPGAIPQGFVDSSKAVNYMLEALELDESEYRLGHTKIFFRAGVLSRLEEERDGILSKMLVGLQAYCRGKLARLAFRFHVGDHQAVGIIQRNVRAYMMLRNWPWWRLYCKIKPMLKELQKRNMQQELEATVAHLKEQLEAEIAARKKAEKQNATLTADMDRVTEDLEFERESVADLEGELQMKERKIKEFVEELEKSDQQFEELIVKQKGLVKEKGELIEQIEGLKDDLAKGSADQARIDRLEKQVGDLQKLLTEAEDALAVKAKAVKTLEASVAELTEKIEDAERNLTAANRAKTHATNQVEDLTAQVTSLSSKHTAAAKKIKQHTQALETEQARTAAVSAELAAVQGKLHKTETKVIQLDEQLANATEKVTQLEKEKKALKKDLEDLSEKDELEAKVNQLQSQLRTRETELEDLNSECDDINDELATVQKDKAALEVRLHQLEAQKLDENAMSGPRVERLKAQLKELEDDLDKSLNRNSKLVAEKKKLEIELKTTKGDLEEESNLLAKSQRQMAKLQQRLKFLTEEKDSGGSAEEVALWQAKHKELRNRLEEEEDNCARLRSEKRRAVRDAEEQSTHVTTLEKEVERLRAQVRRFRKELGAQDGGGGAAADDSTIEAE
mmetsp:Transcript_276/g.707  ORF Transcript_276/g.707 Transcript_276/m.707 type:complete len:1312 (-) Transcript_276:141-4076(-)